MTICTIMLFALRMFLPLPSPMEKILFIFFTLLIFQLVVAKRARVNYVHTGCVSDYGNYTQGSVYRKNLHLLFSNLSSKASVVKFYNYTVGDNTNTVYGLYQCQQDVGMKVCSACIQDATQRIVKVCPSSKEAVVWYQECMLRYANRSIFSKPETQPSFDRRSQPNVENYDGIDHFAPQLAETINGLTKEAASTPFHFATREANLTLSRYMYFYLYSSAQCTPDLDGLGCNNCLRSAESEMAKCCNTSTHGRVFLPSCQLWYNTSSLSYDLEMDRQLPDISPTSSNQPDEEQAQGPSMVVIVFASGAGMLLGFFIWIYKNLQSTGALSNELPPQVESKASADTSRTE